MILSFLELLELKNDVLVFIASIYHKEIEKQLIDNHFMNYYDCYELLNNKTKTFNGFYKDKSLRKFFCPVPFEHMHIYDYGVTLCCPPYMSDLLIGNLQESSIDELWNSPLAQQIRASILDGSYCFCDLDICSYRNEMILKENLNISYYREILEKRISYLEKGPKVLNIGIDPSCNLVCKMCRSHKVDCSKDIVHMQLADEIIKHRWDNVEYIVIAGNGEIFYSSIYKRILDSISEKNFPVLKTINIYSNGVLLSSQIWEKYSWLVQKYNIEVTISVDAYTEETYYKIRKHGVFQAVKNNLAFISNLRKKNKISYLQLNFCVQNDNYMEMVNFANYAKTLGVDKLWFQVIRRATWIDSVHEKGHPNYEHFLKIIRNDIFNEKWIDVGQIKQELGILI